MMLFSSEQNPRSPVRPIACGTAMIWKDVYMSWLFTVTLLQFVIENVYPAFCPEARSGPISCADCALGAPDFGSPPKVGSEQENPFAGYAELYCNSACPIVRTDCIAEVSAK